MGWRCDCLLRPDGYLTGFKAGQPPPNQTRNFSCFLFWLFKTARLQKNAEYQHLLVSGIMNAKNTKNHTLNRFRATFGHGMAGKIQFIANAQTIGAVRLAAKSRFVVSKICLKSKKCANWMQKKTQLCENMYREITMFCNSWTKQNWCLNLQWFELRNTYAPNWLIPKHTDTESDAAK